MMSKGFGLACCLTALASVAAGCGDLLPDSVTIPRSNTTARNASPSGEVQSESDSMSDGDMPTDNRSDISRLTDRATVPNLDRFERSVETAGAEVELAGELAVSETPAVGDASTASGITQVAEGQFSSTHPNYPTSGGMKVFEISGQAIVELADDFSTTRGSDLQLVAYRDAVVPEQIDSSDYVTISELLAHSGASAYPVPQGVDLDEFGAIAIWCAEFNTVFGYAPL